MSKTGQNESRKGSNILPFSFGLVRRTLEFIGFEFREADEHIFQYFYHPVNGRSIIVDTDYELPDSYIRDKTKAINMPYEYFEALSKNLKTK